MRNSSLLVGPVMLVAAVVVSGCGGAGEASQAAAASTDSGGLVRVVNVEVLAVQPETYTERIVVTGAVEAERDVTVASEESGIIRELFVEKGQRVSEGQPIARIDDRVLRAQFDQATSEAALAKETYERQRRLWEDEKIGSELAYLRAKYGAETAEANARMLAARLDRTVVRAPIVGILEARPVEIGTMVGPGTPVARILDVEPLEVIAAVPERYVGEIRVGAAALVGVEAAGSEARGRVRFVGTAVDERTRTFVVEVDVSGGGQILKPGIVARVQLARRTLGNAILVPRDAVMRSETGYIVYVVEDRDGDTVARAREVTTGAGEAGRVVIATGLAAGDRVVVVGQQQLAEGDHVRVAGSAGGDR